MYMYVVTEEDMFPKFWKH